MIHQPQIWCLNVPTRNLRQVYYERTYVQHANPRTPEDCTPVPKHVVNTINYISWFVFDWVHLLVNILNLRKCTVWVTQNSHTLTRQKLFKTTRTQRRNFIGLPLLYGLTKCVQFKYLDWQVGLEFTICRWHSGAKTCSWYFPWITFYDMHLTAFVGQCKEYKKMHGMSNIKMMLQRSMHMLNTPPRGSQWIMHCPCPHPRGIQQKQRYSSTH